MQKMTPQLKRDASAYISSYGSRSEIRKHLGSKSAARAECTVRKANSTNISAR